jgi:hypothetical protein
MPRRPFADVQPHLGRYATAAERLILATVGDRAREQRSDHGAPANWDWRDVGGRDYVGPVKNQGGCASGVSFDPCAVIEATARAKCQYPDLEIDLSEAFLLFCAGGDCHYGLSGWILQALDFAATTGIVDEACMPYEPRDMDCTTERCSDWQPRLTRILSYSTHTTMTARSEAIVQHGSVLGGMVVYSDLLSYPGGIYTKDPKSQYSGPTTVCVIGYHHADGCWIIKKCWGTEWGEGGFCRVAYGQADLKIDSSWPLFSVDPDVVPRKGHGSAQHLFVDKTFGEPTRLSAYAGNGWRSRALGHRTAGYSPGALSMPTESMSGGMVRRYPRARQPGINQPRDEGREVSTSDRNRRIPAFAPCDAGS